MIITTSLQFHITSGTSAPVNRQLGQTMSNAKTGSQHSRNYWENSSNKLAGLEIRSTNTLKVARKTMVNATKTNWTQHTYQHISQTHASTCIISSSKFLPVWPSYCKHFQQFLHPTCTSRVSMISTRASRSWTNFFMQCKFKIKFMTENEPATSPGPQINVARLIWQSSMIKLN